MGGICAIVGDHAEQLVKKICNNLQHRGPDDEGYFTDENIALGKRVLKLTNDLVQYKLLSNEKKTIWITFDGEIYNKEQLIQQLKKNHVFQSNSSAEVVIHAYEDEGYNCLYKLNGMFSFCLWDSKNRSLFSARDRLGLKPLYYYSCKHNILLASEIKGILADSSVPRKPNNRFIYEYLVTGARGTRECSSKTGDTFFAGIKELLPAHYMIINENGIKIQKYWRPTQDLKPNHLIFDDQWYASEFRKLLLDSISIRLPEDLSIGTFLSGGLDSTSLAFLTNETINTYNKINTQQEIFSAIYEGQVEQGDEKHYIKEVENALKTKINYVFPTVENKWDDIKKFIYHIEEPVGVFNYYVYWYLFREAKKKVNVVFHGQGPDEILGGSTGNILIYIKELWKKKKIRILLKELISSVGWASPYMVRSIWFSRNVKSRAKDLLSKNYSEKYSNDKSQMEDVSLTSALVKDTTGLLVEHLRVEDRASSAFSVECRHPFLDHRIVEYIFSLPESQKIRNGYTKYVLRNAMKGIIPDNIRTNKKKAATPIPFQRWINELQPNITELFKSNHFRESGYFNQEAIIDILNRYCEGNLSKVERLYYPGLIWRIINLGLWLEIFFDKNKKNVITLARNN
jgi:asparagine synthase (glutamine-hydrolysing)